MPRYTPTAPTVVYSIYMALRAIGYRPVQAMRRANRAMLAR